MALKLDSETIDLVLTCALRFDGYRYMALVQPEAITDFRQLVEPLVDSFRLHVDEADNFVSFFALQRFLHKWGGETLSHDSPEWRAYLFLFLHLYRQPQPREFSNPEYVGKWVLSLEQQAEKAAATIRHFLTQHSTPSSEGPGRQWSMLNHLQIGRYAEYFVKMEFTCNGCEVFTSEVDDRGIDFVVRRGERFFTVQVKSVRNNNYIFFRKTAFKMSQETLAAIVLFEDGAPPGLYLIPALAWHIPSALLVSHDYLDTGNKSQPEWGINLSHANMALLEPFRFANGLDAIK